ncbi:hypothetical protein AAL_00809 [Moelleriella libera RCEF 2490]|uniref:Uncharacterized protein n=1 Tax=Moelleriella libera RCEF 2490 TaxID=1081109 RepID=A0A166V769_9HYPO|nr:hypothetical protein AAL_00809 [Moelleriella libera RCEF 2490]
MPCRPHPFGPPDWGVHLSRPTEHQKTRFNLPPIPYEVGLEWQRVAGESFQHPALLHQLFEQYNTISIPLLSPEHFYDDALALARQAPTRADLEQSFANKFLERRKELEKALDDVARDVLVKPSLFLTATSQKMARKMTTTCSLQDILGFFCAVSYHLDEDKEKEAIAKRQKEEE